MAGFVPYNQLELALRKLFTREDEQIEPFLDRLAADPLWLLVENDMQPDADGFPACHGKYPEASVFHRRDGSFLGLYTAEERARETLRHFGLLPEEFTCTTRQGNVLLRWFDANFSADGKTRLVINYSVADAAYPVGPDLLRRLLARPAPPLPADVQSNIDPQPMDVPTETLGPLCDYLAGVANARAAFVFGEGPGKFSVGVVMADQEDESILDRCELILRAVTPVETDWHAVNLLGSDETYRQITAAQTPLYATAEFAAAMRS